MDGKKASMPRYYKDRLYTEDERKLIADFYKVKLTEEIYRDFEKLNSVDFIRQRQNHKEAVKADIKKTRQLAHANDYF